MLCIPRCAKYCDLTYVGEIGRTFGKRLVEHKAEVEKEANNIRTKPTRKTSKSTAFKSNYRPRCREKPYHQLEIG